MRINFSNDLGYGSVKGCINGNFIKIPSIAVRERPGDINDPIRFNDKAEARNYMENYLKHMDVSIESSSINHNGRYFIGDSANNSTSQPMTFDVDNFSGKAESDLSISLTLSIIASYAVRKYYLKNDKLPSNGIKANVNMVTALPILEGTRNKTLDYYAKRYTDADHQVTIRNFDNPVPVTIHFDHVLVRLEGQVAVYYIHHADRQLRNNIYNSFKYYYPKLAKLATSKQLVTDKNTLSVDIGEGTTDFAVFNNDAVNINASSSIQAGYGNVLESASKELAREGNDVTSRAQLKEAMNQPTTWSNANNKAVYQKAIDDNTGALIQRITAGLSRSLHDAKNNVDIIYVYGGGAVPMVKALRKPLMIKTRTYNGGRDIPVVFIDSQHAQYMNVNGLELILNALI